MKLLYVLLTILVIFISGCSTKATNIIEYYNSIKMKIDNEKSEKYYLVDEFNQKITSSYASGGVLKFNIPSYVSPNQCFFIKNHKGKDVRLGDSSNKGFKLTILKKYKNISSEIDNINEKIKEAINAKEQHKENYNYSKNSLSNNRAYKEGICIQPEMRDTPSKPSNVLCTSKDECEKEGILLCIKMLLGSEICSQKAKEMGYSSFQSSALCSATAANSLHQKYTLNDAYMDSVWGAIDDYADEKLDNGGFFGKAWGGLLKLTSLTRKKQQVEECRIKFMKKYYNAYLEWQDEVYKIKNEPEKLYVACKNDVESMKRNEEGYYKKEKEISLLKGKKKVLLEKLENIKHISTNIHIGCQ